MHLGEGGASFEPQFKRVFENCFETSLLGLADDVEDRAIGSHQFPDGLARAEEAVNSRAPDGADSIASCAAALLVNDVAELARNVEFIQQLPFVFFGLAPGFA